MSPTDSLGSLKQATNGPSLKGERIVWLSLCNFVFFMGYTLLWKTIIVFFHLQQNVERKKEKPEF